MSSHHQEPKTGFVEWHDCDSLLFTGLVGCIPEVQVGIMTAYQKSSNTWLRKPPQLGRCYEPERPRNQKTQWQRTKDAYEAYKGYKARKEPVDWAYIAKKILVKRGSTISRDMLTGLAWYCWHNKRLDISEKIIQKAMRNLGVMGEGDIARINIMPSLFATFCWISYRLGGPSRAWARWIPADFGRGLTGFQAHLQVLHIMLRAKVTGKMSKRDNSVLREQAKRQPNNPLFLHSVGADIQATRILLNKTLWPAFSLPTKANRSVQWIPMRDEGKDWMPDLRDPKHKHSGGDFLFCSALVLKKI